MPRPFLVLLLAIAVEIVLACSALAGERFLAVGYGGRRMISPDGRTWEITAEWAQPGGDDSNNLMSVVFAEEKFVVVGGGGGGAKAAGHILVSTDGREWTEVLTTKSRVNPVLHGEPVLNGKIATGGRFVAGTGAYPSGKLLWSDDAQTWHEGAKISTNGFTHFRHGAFGNGLYLMVGNAGGQGGRSWVIVSPDGETISHETDALPGHGSVVFGAGRFLMLTSHRQADLLTTTDGIKWTAVNVAHDATFDWLLATDVGFLVGDGKTAYRSADGLAWQPADLTPRSGLKWSDGTRFIGSGWPGKMFFSPNGRTWTESPPLPANGINRVVRGEVH